jgi:hypothetical protein
VAESEVVEQAADELYALPPGDFTRARDARVKEIRGDGDREAAESVKALRKPTVAAWALNQLSRQKSADVNRLVAAGEDLRAAQEELLGGGDRSAFQEAATTERELVAKLSGDAVALAGDAGERASGLQEKVAATLHAAALDEETASELSAGRLTREREAIGGFGAATMAPAPSARGTAKPKAKDATAESKAGSKATGTTASGGAKQAARSKSGAKGAAQSKSDATGAARSKSDSKAARAEVERRQRLAAARTDERHARRELDAAAKAVQHVQERAEAAEAHAAEAVERAKTTAERLREAKKAESAARKAHTRAERALESADSGSSRNS